jgi:hypothetical protein
VFHERFNTDPGFNCNKFERWKDALLSRTQQLLSEVVDTNKHRNLGDPFIFDSRRRSALPMVTYSTQPAQRRQLSTPRVRDCLSAVHEKYVIVDVDKTSHNSIAVCRRFYVLQTVLFIDESDDYVREWNSSDAISNKVLQKLKRILTAVHYADILTYKPKVPNFFLTVKLHKSPYKFRNIANSGRGLFMYHKLVANFLRLLLKTIRLVEVEVWEEDHPPTWWIVDNAHRCLLSLTDEDWDVHDVRTFDVKGMYNNIGHRNLWYAFNAELLDITDKPILGNVQPITGVNVGWEDATWCYGSCNNSDDSSRQYYSIYQMRRMVRACIFEYYVSVANAIFRMIKGVAIGGYASGDLGDIYMHHHEKRFVYRNHQFFVRGGRLFMCARRYRDDIVTCNWKRFARCTRFIYPPDLEFTEGVDEGQQCTYLDMRLTLSEKRITSEVYDKWESEDFTPIRFPHVCSNVSLLQSHTCLQSDLLRMYHLCTHLADFIKHVLRRILPVLEKGYDATTVLRICGRTKDTEEKWVAYLPDDTTLGRHLRWKLQLAII